MTGGDTYGRWPFGQTFEHALRRVRRERHTDTDRIEDGVADRGTGRNCGRLADANDAAFGHIMHVDDDLRDVLDAGQLVELHVGIDLPACVPVHDAFFKEGVVDAHNDAAG